MKTKHTIALVFLGVCLFATVCLLALYTLMNHDTRLGGREASLVAARFGTAFNDTRKANGIPLLDPSWKLTSATKSYLEWSPPTPLPLGVAAYVGKLTKYSGNEPVWEEDCYSDGHTYDWVDPDRPTETCNCSIIIEFDFKKSKSGEDPWTYSYEKGRGFETLTAQEAEDMLKAAGLTRRNY